MLPDLPLEYASEGTNPGWSLRLIGLDGKPRLLPLPSFAEINSNQVVYRPSGYLLRDLRESLMERLVLASPKVRNLENDSIKSFYLRQAALSDASFARVNFMVKLPEAAKEDRSLKASKLANPQ
jgi:hypothetical protein